MSAREAPRANRVLFEGATAILPVRSLEASVDYYARVLGFKVNWQDRGIFASVSRDRCVIFLCQGDQGNPGAWVWIGVADAGDLFEEYRRTGAKIRHPPTNYRWAYEMQIEDLDGNVLRMGSAAKEGPPGEWLDMRGRRWVPSADGGWRSVEDDAKGA